MLLGRQGRHAEALGSLARAAGFLGPAGDAGDAGDAGRVPIAARAWPTRAGAWRRGRGGRMRAEKSASLAGRP